MFAFSTILGWSYYGESARIPVRRASRAAVSTPLRRVRVRWLGSQPRVRLDGGGRDERSDGPAEPRGSARVERNVARETRSYFQRNPAIAFTSPTYKALRPEALSLHSWPPEPERTSTVPSPGSRPSRPWPRTDPSRCTGSLPARPGRQAWLRGRQPKARRAATRHPRPSGFHVALMPTTSRMPVR